MRNALLHLLLTCFINICDVGEEVMALRFGHCEAQLPGVFKHPDQDLQAQQIRMFGRNHLEYCLRSGGKEQTIDRALKKVEGGKEKSYWV